MHVLYRYDMLITTRSQIPSNQLDTTEAFAYKAEGGGGAAGRLPKLIRARRLKHSGKIGPDDILPTTYFYMELG